MRAVRNPDGLTVVAVKHAPMTWGYVIVTPKGRAVAHGRTGANGGPLIRKGAARSAGVARLYVILKNRERIDKALKKQRRA